MVDEFSVAFQAINTVKRLVSEAGINIATAKGKQQAFGIVEQVATQFLYGARLEPDLISKAKIQQLYEDWLSVARLEAMGDGQTIGDRFSGTYNSLNENDLEHDDRRASGYTKKGLKLPVGKSSSTVRYNTNPEKWLTTSFSRGNIRNIFNMQGAIGQANTLINRQMFITPQTSMTTIKEIEQNKWHDNVEYKGLGKIFGKLAYAYANNKIPLEGVTKILNNVSEEFFNTNKEHVFSQYKTGQRPYFKGLSSNYKKTKKLQFGDLPILVRTGALEASLTDKNNVAAVSIIKGLSIQLGTKISYAQDLKAGRSSKGTSIPPRNAVQLNPPDSNRLLDFSAIIEWGMMKYVIFDENFYSYSVGATHRTTTTRNIFPTRVKRITETEYKPKIAPEGFYGVNYE